MRRNRISFLVVLVILTAFSIGVIPTAYVAAQNSSSDSQFESGQLESAIQEREARKQQEDEYRKAIRTLQEMEVSEPAAIAGARPILGETNYTLGIDDVVEVKVRGQEDFSGNFVIGPDGMIQYTYVGDVEAAGLTKTELKEVLTEELKKYVKIPDVSVAILAYRSKTFYVMGDVGHPGKFVMRGDTITLRDALVTAGLPTKTAALKKCLVITPDIDNPQVVKVDLKEVLYKGILKDDLELKSGDLIVVPSTVLSRINWNLEQLLGPLYKAAYLADFGGVDIGN